MIRFFRNLRLGLLKKDSLLKYLSYAIGEILLVVLGILIALQINNMNQNRLDHKSAIEYHQRMVDDLDMIIGFLDDVANFSDRVESGIQDAVEILENKRIIGQEKEILDFALGNYFRLSRHLPELTSYNEMESTGQLNLIYSGELRKKIADYIIFWKLVSTVYEDLNEKVSNQEFIEPYVKFNRDSNFEKISLEYDFDALASDRKVINTLSRYAFHWKTKSTFSRNLRSETVELKEAVEQELERLK